MLPCSFRLLVEFASLWLEYWDSCFWLTLGQGLPAVPCHVPSHNMAAYLFTASKGSVQLQSAMTASYSVTQTQKWHPALFAMSCWLETHRRSYPHSRGGTVQRHECQGVEIVGCHLRAWSPQDPYLLPPPQSRGIQKLPVAALQAIFACGFTVVFHRISGRWRVSMPVHPALTSTADFKAWAASVCPQEIQGSLPPPLPSTILHRYNLFISNCESFNS